MRWIQTPLPLTSGPTKNLEQAWQYGAIGECGRGGRGVMGKERKKRSQKPSPSANSLCSLIDLLIQQRFIQPFLWGGHHYCKEQESEQWTNLPYGISILVGCGDEWQNQSNFLTYFVRESPKMSIVEGRVQQEEQGPWSQDSWVWVLAVRLWEWLNLSQPPFLHV